MSLTLSVKVQKGNCSAGLRVTVKVLNRYIFLCIVIRDKKRSIRSRLWNR